MQLAPMPANEKARQLCVDELDLDVQGNEECFDRVTRLVASALRVPMCAFSVISGDRQIFKSAVGLQGAGAPRALSLCAHTLLENGVVAIGDTRSDPRFNDNPMVVGNPGIRAYVGAPVRAPGGASIGVVCAMDRAPREVSEQERRLIADCARMVENELLLRSMVIRDPVTGVYARSSFCGLADRAWRRARSLGIGSGVILFSVDRYLSYCRAWGRGGTNEVLQLVSEGIERNGPASGAILGRLHDDRFALFMSDSDPGTLAHTAELIRAGVERHCRSKPERYGRNITVSVGVAQDADGPEPDRSLNDLLERAHLALARAKSTTLARSAARA